MERELQLTRLLLGCYEEEYRDGFPFYRGEMIDNRELIMVLSGVGKVCAAMATQVLISAFHPDFVVSTGVAASARADILPGEVVAASFTMYHDVWCGEGNAPGQIQDYPLIYPTQRDLLTTAAAVSRGAVGIFATGDCFIETPEDVKEIVSLDCRIVAIDMESCAVAQVCYRCAVPFIAYRLISDCPLLPESKEDYEGFIDNICDRSFLFLRQFLLLCRRPLSQF